MRDFLRTIRRYLRLLLTFAQNSLAGQLEYRINFLAGLFVESGFMLAKLTYVALIYSANVEINGMSPDYILLFIGTFAIMTGIYMSFYPNFCNIAGYIKDGTLDIYLTKPVSQLFLITFRYIDFAMPIPNIAGGLIMVVIAWSRCGFPVTPGNVLVFMGGLVLGTILTYAIFLLPRLAAFWTVSTNAIVQVSDSIWDFNNMPMKIYNRLIQEVGCFIFPVFLITNMPGLMIGQEAGTELVIWYVAAPFLLLTVTLLVWRVALKRYSSASS